MFRFTVNASSKMKPEEADKDFCLIDTSHVLVELFSAILGAVHKGTEKTDKKTSHLGPWFLHRFCGQTNQRSLGGQFIKSLGTINLADFAHSLFETRPVNKDQVCMAKCGNWPQKNGMNLKTDRTTHFGNIQWFQQGPNVWWICSHLVNAQRTNQEKRPSKWNNDQRDLRPIHAIRGG